MIDFLKTFFRPQTSSATAKERLRLVLLSDHLSLAPDVVESLKADLLAVIRKYVVIDENHADVTFEHREHEIAMLASIPIVSVNGDRSSRLPTAPTPLRPPAATPAVQETIVTAALPLAEADAEAEESAPVPVSTVAPNAARPRRRRRRKRTADGQPALGPVQLQA